ncbi:hypothetical protein ABK905_02250 [Acerihabitans sp. KWT182]|uniref:50S ribosomal protein L29 n=1 Tax=Acerihabitans sp. KWT182 TaxID=3157919 RepID=A0AAU7QAT8_9GAMM
MTKKFKEIRNIPDHITMKEEIIEKLKDFRDQLKEKIVTVKNNRAAHNSKKRGQLDKLSTDMDRFITERKLTYRETKIVTKTPKERNEVLALAKQRKEDKANGHDMGGMVR